MGNIVTVNFRNDTIFGVDQDDGVHIAITPICDTLGLASQKQRERILRDPILSEGATMMVFPSPGGSQETLCLKLDYVHGWLFTIDESRVKDEEVRQRVLSYKRECYAVLAKHFYGRSFGERTTSLHGPNDAGPDAEEPVATKRQLVTEARQTFGTQAAREMWFKMNLPTVPSMYADPTQGDFFYFSAIKRDPPASGEAA